MLPDMDRRNRNRYASKGAVTLGDIVGRVGMLEVARRERGRYGSLDHHSLV
jgi:hypothetical protein